MNFGEALEALKAGKRVARRGWNGKGAYLWYMPPQRVFVANWASHVGVPNDPTPAERELGYVRICGHIDMMSAQGERVIGWLASQTDLLSDDWEIIQ